jgi:ribosome-associated toxin RatA of RatAB toxin-antitoxin module
MIARLFPLLFGLLFAASLPAFGQAGKLDVAVKRADVDGQHQFDVTASGTVQAAPAAVWKVLTTYERMPEFVPDLRSAKVLSRTPNRAVIEQVGVARFLFFQREIHLVVQAIEEPNNRIDVSLVDGDMRVYQCRWELTPVPETGGTRIVYTGKLAPRFYVPSMLGANLIRSDIERMMAAVLTRLDQPE